MMNVAIGLIAGTITSWLLIVLFYTLCEHWPRKVWCKIGLHKWDSFLINKAPPRVWPERLKTDLWRWCRHCGKETKHVGAYTDGWS